MAALPNNGLITILDNTEPLVDSQVSGDEDDLPSRSRTLTSRLTGVSLREELLKRKYSKYGEERYLASKDTRPGVGSRNSTTLALGLNSTNTSNSVPEQEDIAESPISKDGRLRRGKQKVKSALRRKRQQQTQDGDVEIDVLFENQRGAFFFGTPLFSSQGLLNFDPPKWINVQGKPSPVDITNAQVPDPSWHWEWPTWYVDMSADVDEHGWEYSFSFQQRFAWHGTHPWLHSFVRRRRWIRKRVRTHTQHASRVEEASALKEGHKLNADYFTIHQARTRSPDSRYDTQSLKIGSPRERWYGGELPEELHSMPVLLRSLKFATIDREKINLVLRFIEEGGQDVHYLADEMPRIMSAFIYQYTRRQLLASIMRRIDAASAHRDEHASRREEEHDNEKHHIDNLLRAVDAAEKEVQHLEYWSDIVEVVRNGELPNAMAEEKGWDHGWQGVDASGAVMSEPVDGKFDSATIIQPNDAEG